MSVGICSDLDPRREVGDLGPGLGDRLAHDVEDLEPALLGLPERLLQELGRDARDLHVHLQRGDAVPGTCDLEVHVAHVVLEPLDVAEDDVVLALLDEAHRDPRHGAFIGAPPSISASVEPQTLAIEDEPLDSSTSEMMRRA